jgi:hypothetical protein
METSMPYIIKIQETRPDKKTRFYEYAGDNEMINNIIGDDCTREPFVFSPDMLTRSVVCIWSTKEKFQTYVQNPLIQELFIKRDFYNTEHEIKRTITVLSDE